MVLGGFRWFQDVPRFSKYELKYVLGRGEKEKHKIEGNFEGWFTPK